MKVALIGCLVVASLAARASADPLADALTRHADADVAVLRAELPGDPSIRCTLGAVYAKRGDLPRAALYLTDCEDATLPDTIAADIARTAHQLETQLRASDLSALEVVSVPEGMNAEIDALPGEQITTPATLWIKAGHYEVRAKLGAIALTNTVTTEAHKRGSVILDSGLAAAATQPPRALVMDEEPTDQHIAPPPPTKQTTLLPERFRGAVALAGTGGPEIADPCGVECTSATSASTSRTWRLGLRVGGGVFDDGNSAARAGLAFAITSRVALGPRSFVATRLDWSRRGGTSGTDTPVDVLGAAAGLGATLATLSSVSIAVVGQLRGDLRLETMRDASPIPRAGLGLAAAVELGFPTTPLTAALRLEQGLTALAHDARDRALLAELGIDF